MRFRPTIALFLTVVTLPFTCLADGEGQRWSADFTYRTKEEGKLTDRYHVVSLACSKQDCEWVTVTLNLCIGGAFFPKIEKLKSRDGDFTIKKVGANLWELRFKSPSMTIMMEAPCKGRAYGDYCTRQVKDLNGSFTIHSDILNKLLTTNLELAHPTPGGEKLGCDKVQIP